MGEIYERDNFDWSRLHSAMVTPQQLQHDQIFITEGVDCEIVL